jgi:tRNA threonylcarbamoyladenosine biosynthesis protein TsaB
MKILAIETSTDACSAALSIGTTILERFEVSPKSHTKLLLPMIDNLFREAGFTLGECDALAFGCGPGSFTGLRIASAIIQGLSFGTNKPVIPVSTLRVVAQGYYRETHSSHIFATIDARLQEIYWGLFVVDEYGIMHAASKEYVQKPEDVILPEGNWIKAEGYPHAKDIVAIAEAEFLLGHLVSPFDALPVYIRHHRT